MLFVQFLYFMLVDQASFYCSWLSISQDLVSRHEMNFCQTILVLREGQGARGQWLWCPDVVSWQYFKHQIFLFAQLSLTLLRAKNQLGTKRGVNLVIFSSHVAIIFIVDVPNFSLDWWNNIQLSCLALACWWMRISNDPIARQDKPPPTLPSLHLLHVPSTSLSPCLSISPLIASWWAGVW